MHDFRKSLNDSTLGKVLKLLHYPLEVMLTRVRGFVKLTPLISLSYLGRMCQESRHRLMDTGGHLRANGPADQEKAIVYNELVTNAVALQNVVDQTQALHTLKSNGVSIRPADLAFLSPYATSKLKRFGDYPTDLQPEAMPIRTTLPS